MEDLIKHRREQYAGSQKDALLASDGQRNFFKNVKNYKSAKREAPFDVLTLFPGKSEPEVAEILAEHFNSISSEFDPLEQHQIPVTRSNEVAGRIRHFKKPKSMVRGDIFPALVSLYGDFLAIPLSNIYNEITVTRVWPRIWKEEYVTTIPKKSVPESVNDLRNISCTMLASKICLLYTSDAADE